MDIDFPLILVVLTLVASSGFERVFSGHGYVGPLLGAAVVPGLMPPPSRF